MIVDDEPPARERIRALLADERDVAILQECDSGLEAVSAIRELEPDLVFLDVQMPGLDGFGVLEALGQERVPVIVFVTAYDAYAVRAFEVHALDYLLKPFDRERFQATLERARLTLGDRADEASEPVAVPLPDSAGRPPLRRLLGRRDGRLIVLKAGEIDWVESAANYVSLHVGKESYLVRETLQSLEGRLDPELFIRIHRSTIVNLDRVQEIEPYFHGDYIVRLRDGQRLTLSRTYRDRVQRHLGKGI
jgi:two-component system LytT family response regulator